MYRDCVEMDVSVATRVINMMYENNMKIEIVRGVVQNGYVKVSYLAESEELFNKVVNDAINEEYDLKESMVTSSGKEFITL